MLYSPNGNRKQASIHGIKEALELLPPPPGLVTGVITDVYCVDREDSSGNPLNFPGTYLTYTVKIAPTGVFIHNVPVMDMSSGHTKFRMNTDASNSLSNQNTEETPLSIGQPVIIGFLFGSGINPIILGAAPCQMNASTMSSTGEAPFLLDPQTAGNGANPGDPPSLDPETGASSGDNIYPQKQGSFQGTTWKIDKNGNPTVNIVTNGTLKVEVNGTPFITVDGENNLVDIGTGIEFGVLGNTLQTFLSTLETWLDSHTHISAAPTIPTGPASAAPTGPSPTPPTITTTVLKVE